MDQAVANGRFTMLWETPYSLWGVVATIDHKTNGIRYTTLAVVGAMKEIKKITRPGDGLYAFGL